MERTAVAKVEKIVDYTFERNEKSVLAIHPTRSLIAYLINIQRPTQNNEPSKTASIRVIDYNTRQRCLAKGIYHSRPADCVFAINSQICTRADVLKLAVVDKLANIYLYDLAYFMNDLVATRIAVIRGPAQDVSPYEYISLVWCPFVPCEDFSPDDGGLRLALATNCRIEIIAVDRLRGKTGEIARKDLKGAYKCIDDAHKANIVAMSISPDCSSISAAALDNRVAFFSSDIDETDDRCLHNWEVSITDKSSISQLFFLDDYPKLLEDSTMKFWGACFVGTKSGQVLLVDLRTWSVYQKMTVHSDDLSGPKNYDYKIDLTSKYIVAVNNGTTCSVMKIEHERDGLPKIVGTVVVSLHNSIYSFVIKRKSEAELEIFTISAFSLERYTVNLNDINWSEAVERRIEASNSSVTSHLSNNVKTSKTNHNNNIVGNTAPSSINVDQMDRVVEALFNKLNTTFSQGLDEFLSEVKCEVNDLKLKLNGLSRDVNKLQQQLQEARQK